MSIRELKPYEKEKAYAKYFECPMAPPNEKSMDEIRKGPMDAKYAITPEQINTMLQHGDAEVENGYCIMPNGTAYVATSNFFPGCTLEMMQWWFAWHALEPLRYSIWHKNGHHSVAVSDIDRAKILDPDLPLEEKSRGVIHFVVEDMGAGLDDILIHFMSPKEMGFDMEKFHEPAISGVIGGWCERHSRVRDEAGVSIMLHTFREKPEGLELRTRFWLGYKYLKGHPVCMMPPGMILPEEGALGLAVHSIEEYSNLAAILPELYEQQKDLWE